MLLMLDSSLFDLSVIKRFYDGYPGFPGCAIEPHDDTKKREDSSLSCRCFDLQIDKLIQLNIRGAGIFFSINSMLPGKRDKESTTCIVAWACDIDHLPKDEQWLLLEKSPLKPSCIIESKRSLHLCRFAIDGTKENRQKIQSRVIGFFGADGSLLSNYAGMLRMPGFLHMKDPSDPFVVKLRFIDPEICYTEEQMLGAFPMLDHESIEITSYQGTYNPNEHGIWGIISAWNNEEMLKALSGDSIINRETIKFKKNSDGSKQIIVNSKSTGCRIDPKGMIGSAQKGGPTWVQRVLRYKNISKSQLLNYVKEKFAHRVPPEQVFLLDKANYLNGHGKVLAIEFARYLKETQHFEGIEGNLFKYFPEEGIWKHLNDNLACQIIIREAQEFLELLISKPELEAILRFLKVHAESQVIKEKLQYVSQFEISLADGILDTTTWTIRPYTKEDYKFSKLPFSSTDIADYERYKPTRTIRFLQEIFASYKDTDAIGSYIWEVIGHLLLPVTKFGQMFILHGGGWNGKGQFLGLIRNILGDHNCSTIELHKLEDVDREKLLGKLVAIDSDTSDNVRLDIGPLRKIIDGEPIEARKRYGHPFDFRPFARIIIAANVEPEIRKMDTNMSRRIVFIPFRENFKDRSDPELKEKLKEESIGSFTLALHGLKRLMSRGYFAIPEEIQYETQQYLKEFLPAGMDNGIDIFLDQLGLVPGYTILCKNMLYTMYQDYCRRKSLRKYLGKQQLTQALLNKGFLNKDSGDCRGIGIDQTLLDMTFVDNILSEKSFEDTS